MSISVEKINRFINSMTIDNLTLMLREAGLYQEKTEYDVSDEYVINVIKIGHLPLSNPILPIPVFYIVLHATDINERIGKRKQYEFAKKLMGYRDINTYHGVFVYTTKLRDKCRFSLIDSTTHDTRLTYSKYKRYTFFIDRNETNKTFKRQFENANFNDKEQILHTFSVQAVTKAFFDEYSIESSKLTESIESSNAEVISVLFAIRIIFLCFIQKKKWLDNDLLFLKNYYEAYQLSNFPKNTFYQQWLCPLFFYALNQPSSNKSIQQFSHLPEPQQQALIKMPYLNGGLFIRKDEDEKDVVIADRAIESFFDFIFSHNITIDENTPSDADLELSPLFLGIIFERQVNKEYGAIYTPRPEVDLICKLSLLEWLDVKSIAPYETLVDLIFSENISDSSTLTTSQKNSLLSYLENISICDPAAGSGEFLVGMLHILEQLFESINPVVDQKDKHNRTKNIIEKSLYGVEVKEWAVWICQLRLWLSIFITAPNDLKASNKPILPSLDFKIIQGDSLVQTIGDDILPKHSYDSNFASLRTKQLIEDLCVMKKEVYNNTLKASAVKEKQRKIYAAIANKHIEGIETKIGILKGGINSQTTELFNNDFIQQKVNKQIRDQITMLRESRASYKTRISSKQIPFFWEYEFPEIIYNKKGFNIIIGNPPYVRQEGIADPLPNRNINKDKYKKLLYLFAESCDCTRVDKKSDLYTYFYLLSNKILNPGGINSFICSNSWLDINFGKWLKEYLLSKTHILYILDSSTTRTFENASINTIISITRKLGNSLENKANCFTKFVSFKQSLEDSSQISLIQSLKKETGNNIKNEYQLRVASSNELFESQSPDMNKSEAHVYKNSKWNSVYLRAPDIYFTIIHKGKDKFVKLEDVSKIQYGMKSGNNDYFYLTQEKINKWKIEPQFLKPIVKSPKECLSIKIDGSKFLMKAFICNKTKKELSSTNALRYIEWGEEKEYNKKITSLKNKRLWYSQTEKYGNTFVPKFTHDRFAVFISDAKIICNDALYYGQCSVFHQLYLNSILFYLFMELFGRNNLGDGARELKVYEVNELPVLQYTKSDHSHINQQPGYFENRLGSIFEECGLDQQKPINDQIPKPAKERRRIDDIFFDVLNLSENERTEVYRAVCSLVQNRLNRAKSI